MIHMHDELRNMNIVDLYAYTYLLLYTYSIHAVPFGGLYTYHGFRCCFGDSTRPPTSIKSCHHQCCATSKLQQLMAKPTWRLWIRSRQLIYKILKISLKLMEKKHDSRMKHRKAQEAIVLFQKGVCLRDIIRHRQKGPAS